MKSGLKIGHARLFLGAASTFALMCATGGPALAQETTDDIIVTGIRASLEESAEAKREETSIVEVISAEDIGRLPDMSIADSLARLPGLTAQRLNGRSQVISVRGLAPDFTTALLNGREQVSTSDNRSAEFDQYPSELINQVVVYKTPDASLIGQGLAGTADMRTVNPIDFGRRAVALNYRYEWNEYGALNSGTEDTGQRYSLSYIDQTEDGRLGWALGYAHLDSPSQGERFNAWGYPNTGTGFDPNNPLVIGGAKPYVQSNELERDGVIGILEFRPTNTFRTSIDAYYSEFTENQTLRGIELPLWWGGGVSLAPGYTVEDGLITQGTYNNVEGVVRNDLNQREAQMTSIGWNAQWDFAPSWTAELDVNYGRVEREDKILETNSGTGYGVGGGASDTIGFITRPGAGTTFTHTLDYSDPTLILLTAAQGWGTDVGAGRPFGQAGFLNNPSIEDELRQTRLSATRDFDSSWLDSVEFGINYTDREKSKSADEFYLTLASGNPEDPIPADLLIESTDLAYLGLGPMVSYDPLALLNSGVLAMVRNTNADVITKSWLVEENVLTAYAQFNINTEMHGMPLRGNFGLQVVNTDQSSDGFAASGNAPNTSIVAVTDGAEYTDYLPSLNLSLEFMEDNFLRVGIARTLSRPRLDQLNASQQFNRNAGNLLNPDPNHSYFSSSGGNPHLQPWIANSFDVSYERYFGESGARGYVAVAAFYKDLENYIYTQSAIFDFSGFPVEGGATPGTFLGRYDTPQNGEGGSIYGLELTASVPFETVLPALEGFGVIFNASFNESSIEPNGPGSNSSLPGLSDQVASLTLYYERAGFQARISDRYRSDFLGEVAGFGNGRDFTFVESEQVVDAQVGYTLQNGPLEGLGFLFQVQNLTDQEFVTYYNNDPRQVRDYQRYGQTYMFGVNYNFN